jgi:predicted nuclease of predicted toxin-antitoxin system
MPRTIRFHLGENCHRAIGEGLRRRGVDVTTTPEVGLLRATDGEQLAYCLKQARVLFTQDHDFLRLHAEGTPHAGIAYSRKDTQTIGTIIQSLVLIWEVLEPEEIEGRVEYL